MGRLVSGLLALQMSGGGGGGGGGGGAPVPTAAPASSGAALEEEMRQLQLQLQQQADSIQAGAWQEEEASAAAWQQQDVSGWQQAGRAARDEDDWQQAARPQRRSAAGRGAGRAGPIPAGGRGSGGTPLTNPGGGSALAVSQALGRISRMQPCSHAAVPSAERCLAWDCSLCGTGGSPAAGAPAEHMQHVLKAAAAAAASPPSAARAESTLPPGRLPGLSAPLPVCLQACGWAGSICLWRSSSWRMNCCGEAKRDALDVVHQIWGLPVALCPPLVGGAVVLCLASAGGTQSALCRLSYAVCLCLAKRAGGDQSM